MVKKFMSLLVLVVGLMGCQKDPYADNPQLKAAYELVERVIPGYGNQFLLEQISQENGKDVFEIEKCGKKICLRGNNGVSIASALNWYLKYTCQTSLSWCGDQLTLPEKLPLPKDKIHKMVEAQYRVYFNYCTINYSASWWDWKRWEREIDFMAMNGINMPLSVIGLEGVWYNTLLKFGFSDEEARSFLVGPAYFAWQWMTNIQSQGGPLPKSWIDSHIELGKQIINRQVALGMQPIQQGFSGFVPREMIKKFPDARILQEGQWCGFKGTAQLDPLDPLFKKFGKAFLEEERRLFGSHGVYAADPFHEGAPPKDTPEYLNAVGKAIIGLLTDFDPQAKWAMQAWSIRKEIATAVSKEQLLVLDLNGSRWRGTDHFWGYDFVAGNLHNFGGRINMHGDLPLLASNQYQRAKEKAPNAVGSGLFMESIGQNPVYYDLAFEMAFHADSVNLKSWLADYATRRYGAVSPKAPQAWQLLLDGPYRKGTNGVEKSSIICARPAVDVKKSGPNAGFHIPYPPQELIEAMELLAADATKLQGSEGYRYDMVDVMRQVLTNLGQEVHKKVAQAFKDKNVEAFNIHSSRFLDLLKDVDQLLATRSEFRFEKWVYDARSWGVTEGEKDLYDYNASMLVTQWGADGDARIFDYSWREWSGLIREYYLPRWKKFYGMLGEHLANGTSYHEAGLPLVHGREALRANDFYDELADRELQWINTSKKMSPDPVGDEVAVVEKLLNKYRLMFKEYY